MSLTIRKVLATVALSSALAVTAIAQTGASSSLRHGPSKATRAFIVLPAQSLGDLERNLRSETKTAELLGGEGMQLRVAVQHEKDNAPAAGELHDASDDVYYVLEGTARLTLGGKLEAPHEVEPGEWRGTIDGGQNIEIRKGDLIVVPRGTPHQRSTANKNFTMILIKIYAEPLKKKS